jgi:hypothetical protein
MAKTVVAQAAPKQGPKSIFSPLDTTKLTEFTVDEGYDNELGAHTYHPEYKDAKGNVFTKRGSVEASDSTDPIYTATYTGPLKVGGQTFNAQYGEDGNFQVGYGKEFYKNGHHWLPVLDAQGNISYTNNDNSSGFGDFVKMVALSALTAGVGSAFGGASGLGQSLYGLSGTAGQIAGGATLGAGRAAISGGDILKGALTGGLGGAGHLGIGDTGFTVGQAMTAVNALKAAEKGDWMNAITGAASLSGAGSTQIGNTGYTLGDLAKNAKLAQAVLSGNPQAIIGAITKVAGSANKDIIQSLTDAGMSGPQAKDFIKDYFAPGGEGYVEPADNGGFTSQWQTSGSDRIMIQDDGSAIAINENGDSYSLTKEEVDQMVNNGQLNTAASGYVAATGGTGNTPGGTRTAATQTPAGRSGTPFAGTPNAAAPNAAPNAAPTATRIGLDPLDVLKMKNDVAHINPLEELFGGSIYDQTPASSAHNQTDVVEAATGGQIYSSGGDIHALLQLLRS